MSERPSGLDDESNKFKASPEETDDSSKKGFLGSALDSAKEKLGSTREKISASWEKLTDKEQIAALQDKAELAAEKAIDSIAEYRGKAWQAIRHDAVPLIGRMIENKKVQLSTIGGATTLLGTMLARSTMNRATVAGIRNVGNIAAPVVGTIAGAVAGGTIAGVERFISEKTRVKNERSFESYEALLSQEEIEKLKPTDRVRRLVAAKSFLNRERSRFESKGFYGDKGRENDQLEILRARLEAIDLSSAMSGGELRRSKGIYDRLSKALELRDSADKQITALSSRDLELIAKCERKLSSGVDGAKIRRGIFVGGLVGGLGGLVGGLVGNAFFGSHHVDAPKFSANPEDVFTPNPETATAPLTEATTPEAPSQAPVETPVEPKPSVPPVEVEKPAAPAPVETAVVDKNPSSIKIEKGQTIWGEVEKISKANGVKLSAEEHNNIVRAIAEDNKIAIKADGQGLHGLDEFDTDLKPGHELNMSKSHELINEKLLAKASLPVEEAKPNPGGGSPEVPPPNVDTTTPPDTTPTDGQAAVTEQGGAQTPDGQELPDQTPDNTNAETNPENSNTNTNENNLNPGADQGNNTNEQLAVNNPDGQGDVQNPTDNPPASEASVADYAQAVNEYTKKIGKAALIANALGGLALASLVGVYKSAEFVSNKIEKYKNSKDNKSSNEVLISQAETTPEASGTRVEASVVESDPISLPSFESSTDATSVTIKPEEAPTAEDVRVSWERFGSYKGLVGVGLDNFVRVMRDDGKSDLYKLVDSGYINQGQFFAIRRELLFPLDYSKLSSTDKEGIQYAFELIHQIKDNDSRSTVQKIISRIVSWNPEVLAPIAAEVDKSRKTRHVRKDAKKTSAEKSVTPKPAEVEFAPEPLAPEIPKPVAEAVTPSAEAPKPITSSPETIKNPEFIGAPFEAGQVFMMPNTLERNESGRRENKFIISRNEKTGELETIPKMKRLSEANDYYIYYKEYFDIADGQTASSGNIELIKPATFDYNANANNFELKEKGLIRIVQ